MHPQNNMQQVKGSNAEVDKDGFQQVKFRKNIWRTIFDNGASDARDNIPNLRQQTPRWATTVVAIAVAHNNKLQTSEAIVEPQMKP